MAIKDVSNVKTVEVEKADLVDRIKLSCEVSVGVTVVVKVAVVD